MESKRQLSTSGLQIVTDKQDTHHRNLKTPGGWDIL